MIIGIAHLFTQTKENIAKLRGVKLTGFIDDQEVYRVYNRAAQICALDTVLHQHRKQFANKLNLLQGKDALYHKLLTKYQWPMSEIKALSLSDCLLALHDELQIEGLPGEVSEYLNQVLRMQYPVNFPDYLEDEWDPALSDKFLIESAK
ncbi:hypothetical protein EC036_24910 [Enterobacter cloacae]|uniref:ECs1072 family phage-associated protein n=1 Tax=Enterobacter cloacae TaxID=550 RepID=UPI00052AF910|nr:hypothetical protein [Enterobacter cloacae]AIV30138.1 hypothetical protein EC036_24910 [Enterobacter cloacae]